MTEEKDKKPNPAVTDNGDGTKTLEYRETEDQRRIRETAAQTATPAKPGAKPA